MGAKPNGTEMSVTGYTWIYAKVLRSAPKQS